MSPLKNLLYVITKLELGGAQKHLLSLAAGIDRSRFRLFLFTAREGLLISQAELIPGLALEKSRYLERAVNPAKDLLALLEIYRFIKKNNIDIVHTHSSKAGILGRWAARLAGVKVIIHTVHGWPFHDYQGYFWKKIFLWLERFSAKFTDKIIIVSDFDRNKGLASGIGDPDQYVLIRYGINYSEFKAKDKTIRQELGLSENDPVVGMISCFKPQKSPQDFVRLASLICAAMPNVKFVLAGDGVLRKRLEHLIKRLGLENRIALIGWRHDIPRILSAIDIFVLTSLWEGLPISALEAMAAALPVMATNSGGIAEVISSGENGFLVEPRNINELAERVSLLLKDKDLREEMGRKAEALLGDNFRLQGMVKDTQQLYESFNN